MLDSFTVPPKHAKCERWNFLIMDVDPAVVSGLGGGVHYKSDKCSAQKVKWEGQDK